MTTIELLDTFGTSYLREGHHHCRSGWIQMDCPNCGPGSGKFHLGLNLQSDYFACWQCKGIKFLPTLSEVTGQPIDKLRKLHTKELSLDEEDEKNLRGRLVLPQGLGPLKKAHRQYLRSRNFDPDELESIWKIQGLGMEGKVKFDEKRIRLPWRIFIPITKDNKQVSWTTRAISKDAGLRYISAPAACERHNHKELLYGEEFCGENACLVEGPFDVWRGGPGFVGTFGTAFTRMQAARFSKYRLRGICFDNEPVAQANAEALRDELSIFPGETYIIKLDSKDPGSATERELNTIRRRLKLL